MKKILRIIWKILKFILIFFISLHIIILIFLVFINNKEFVLHNSSISAYNDCIVDYTRKKTDANVIFHLKNMTFDIKHNIDYTYTNDNGEDENYIEIMHIKFRKIPLLKSFLFALDGRNWNMVNGLFYIKSKEYYYQNGQLAEIWNYIERNIYDYDFPIYDNGETYSYYLNGQIATVYNTKNRLLNGGQYTYFDDGSIYISGYYDNGNGKVEYFTPEGDLIGKGEFVSGKPYSGLNIDFRNSCFWRYRDKDGEYALDNLPEIFPEISFYEYYKDGKLDGEYKGYYYCKEVNYPNFYLRSNLCKYNGSLALSGYYEDGKAEGEFIKYYRDGSLFEKCFYVNGIGDCISYYRDGNILREGKKNNGQEFGDRIYYDKNGVISEIFELTSCSSGKSKN